AKKDSKLSHPKDALQQRSVYLLLTKKVPAEIALVIINEAEYWVKSSYAARSEPRGLQVNEHNSPTPYITSEPIEGQIQAITFTITSHDQGWSSYPEDHGTYMNSWTWFEAGIVPPGEDEVSKAFEGSKRLATNRHAVGEAQTHIVMVRKGERPWLNEVVPGSKVVLEAHARFGGWVNWVIEARIDIYTSFL